MRKRNPPTTNKPRPSRKAATNEPAGASIATRGKGRKPPRPKYKGRLIEYIRDGEFQQSVKGFFYPTMVSPTGETSSRTRFFEPYDGWWMLVYSTVEAAIKSIGLDASQAEFALTQIEDSAAFVARAKEDGCRIALDAHRGADDNMHFFEVSGVGLPAWN